MHKRWVRKSAFSELEIPCRKHTPFPAQTASVYPGDPAGLVPVVKKVERRGRHGPKIDGQQQKAAKNEEFQNS
jgi:hypothetical protein